jgi:hypothetical protein
MIRIFLPEPVSMEQPVNSPCLKLQPWAPIPRTASPFCDQKFAESLLVRHRPVTNGF